MLEQQVTGGDEQHVERDHNLQPVAHRRKCAPASAAALAWTPAISAGTKIGTARIGNNMSPPRVRPVIAESSVASAGNPIAPAQGSAPDARSIGRLEIEKLTPSGSPRPLPQTAMKINARRVCGEERPGSSGLSSRPRIAPLRARRAARDSRRASRENHRDPQRTRGNVDAADPRRVEREDQHHQHQHREREQRECALAATKLERSLCAGLRQIQTSLLSAEQRADSAPRRTSSLGAGSARRPARDLVNSKLDALRFRGQHAPSR